MTVSAIRSASICKMFLKDKVLEDKVLKDKVEDLFLKSPNEALQKTSEKSPLLGKEPELLETVFKTEQFSVFIFRTMWGEETTLEFQGEEAERKVISGKPEILLSGKRVVHIKKKDFALKGESPASGEKEVKPLELIQEIERNQLALAFAANGTFSSLTCYVKHIKSGNSVTFSIPLSLIQGGDSEEKKA